MTPYELLLSESQERMLLVARAGREDEVRRIFERWDLDAVVVGRVTDDGRMRIRWHGERSWTFPSRPSATSSPELDRPVREPADLARAPEARPGLGRAREPTCRGALLRAARHPEPRLEGSGSTASTTSWCRATR